MNKFDDLTEGRNENLKLANPAHEASDINCVNLKGPIGPLLLVDYCLADFLKKEGIQYQLIKSDNKEVININWLNYKNPNTEFLLNNLGVNSTNVKDKLLAYIENYIPNQEYKENTERYLIG